MFVVISHFIPVYPALKINVYTCLDLDECSVGTHMCAEVCQNTNGGYVCGCYDPRAHPATDMLACVGELKHIVDLLSQL